MNRKEKEIVVLLSEMRDKFGVVGVKAEFEAEGTRFEELLRLKEIASRCGLNIALKIGGPEDVWGLLQARRIGVSDIVAPMIESAYGLSKFLDMFNKYVPEDEQEDLSSAINIETIKAYEELFAILRVGVMKGLGCVTVGRVDLAGSLGLPRNAIDSERISGMVHMICSQAKRNGFRATIGGAIEKNSLPLITSLVDLKILDRFETRKIIFDARKGLVFYEEAIRNAHKFELLWLTNKRNYYGAIASEDDSRIPMLEKRVNG